MKEIEWPQCAIAVGAIYMLSKDNRLRVSEWPNCSEPICPSNTGLDVAFPSSSDSG
jgi:hypothetical protein